MFHCRRDRCLGLSRETGRKILLLFALETLGRTGRNERRARRVFEAGGKLGWPRIGLFGSFWRLETDGTIGNDFLAVDLEDAGAAPSASLVVVQQATSAVTAASAITASNAITATNASTTTTLMFSQFGSGGSTRSSGVVGIGVPVLFVFGEGGRRSRFWYLHRI